jgi:hypothetical protein
MIEFRCKRKLGKKKTKREKKTGKRKILYLQRTEKEDPKCCIREGEGRNVHNMQDERKTGDKCKRKVIPEKRFQ